MSRLRVASALWRHLPCVLFSTYLDVDGLRDYLWTLLGRVPDVIDYLCSGSDAYGSTGLSHCQCQSLLVDRASHWLECPAWHTSLE